MASNDTVESLSLTVLSNYRVSATPTTNICKAKLTTTTFTITNSCTQRLRVRWRSEFGFSIRSTLLFAALFSHYISRGLDGSLHVGKGIWLIGGIYICLLCVFSLHKWYNGDELLSCLSAKLMIFVQSMELLHNLYQQREGRLIFM